MAKFQKAHDAANVIYREHALEMSDPKTTNARKEEIHALALSTAQEISPKIDPMSLRKGSGGVITQALIVYRRQQEEKKVEASTKTKASKKPHQAPPPPSSQEQDEEAEEQEQEQEQQQLLVAPPQQQPPSSKIIRTPPAPSSPPPQTIPGLQYAPAPEPEETEESEEESEDNSRGIDEETQTQIQTLQQQIVQSNQFWDNRMKKLEGTIIGMTEYIAKGVSSGQVSKEDREKAVQAQFPNYEVVIQFDSFRMSLFQAWKANNPDFEGGLEEFLKDAFDEALHQRGATLEYVVKRTV